MVLVIHGGSLPFTVGQTYDAYIHMFFGDRYHKSWFDPWEPRWYTGFAVTAYPPGGHQLIGLLLNVVSHKMAFICVQITAACILTIGIYRFSKIWVNDFSSALAALLFAMSTSMAETMHVFGQLPTTLSIGIFLNGTPHIFSWIKKGRWSELVPSLIFTAGATAAHHVTPIFATLLFVAPVGLYAWRQSIPDTFKVSDLGSLKGWQILLPAPIRGGMLGGVMLALIIIVVFPYWHWSVTDPINQVSIPHGSRESFIERLDLGLMFFVIPWGVLIFIIPFVAWCAVRTPLWPLALSVLLCLLLGTGGTTPIPEMMLGHAFHILTLDRFTFWAGILIMPFAGLVAESFLQGRIRHLLNAAFGIVGARLFLAAGAIIYGVLGILVAALPLFRPTQPDFIEPGPLIQFMSEDYHNRWRYLTLGFGDQFAYHSALIDGNSIDGNYHSARRLSDLTSYSVERLENAKYLGVPGLGSLRQFVSNANDYNLKYIFSNDEFYDPLLYYAGWVRLLRLQNGVVIWEKPGIEPLVYPLPRRTVPDYQVRMWGTIPPASLLSAFLFLAGLALRGRLIEKSTGRSGPVAHNVPTPMEILLTRSLLGLTGALILALYARIMLEKPEPPSPKQVVESYFDDLDFRRFRRAFEHLNPETRPEYEQYLKILRSLGGLVHSYSKLLQVKTIPVVTASDAVTLLVEREYLTAVGTRKVRSEMVLQRSDDGWVIEPVLAPKTLLPTNQVKEIVYNTTDLTVARMVETRLAVKLDRPVLQAQAPVLVNVLDRIRVIGQVTNHSLDSACVSILADARWPGADMVKRQYTAELGAYRLLPGETKHYSIEFEGVLRLQDAELGQGFDPDFFRFPEFEGNPEIVNVSINGEYCAFDYLSGLVLENIDLDFQLTKPVNFTAEEGIQFRGRFLEYGPGTSEQLSLDIVNTGTRAASVVRMNMIYHDTAGRPVLIEPYYVETNMIPGEKRHISARLSDLSGIKVIRELTRLEVNGLAVSATRRKEAKPANSLMMDNSSRITLELDSMPFEPTF